MKYLSVISVLVLLVLSNAGSMACAQEPSLSNPAILTDISSLENRETKTFALRLAQANEESFDDDEDALMLEEEIEEEMTGVADPIYYWNKGMYHFNDKCYFWLLKPAARGYGWAVPKTARRGVKNFFTNLGFPIRFVGCLLQAKGKAAVGECGKFLMNTTVGVLGFGDPARKYPSLNPNEEDVGQAFGKWGIGNGFYVVWPFLGPSTLRDSVGLVGEYFLDPVSYVDSTSARIGIKAYDAVNSTSFRIGDYEAVKNAALDPYVAIRNGYIQAREKQVRE